MNINSINAMKTNNMVVSSLQMINIITTLSIYFYNIFQWIAAGLITVLGRIVPRHVVEEQEPEIEHVTTLLHQMGALSVVGVLSK